MNPQTYDVSKTWQWNLDHAPAIEAMSSGSGKDHPRVSADQSWAWCGLPVTSPLGISAGPLLDSRWLLHYAALEFDILVYKTVRSSARECYELPNLVPVSSPQLSESGTTVLASPDMNGSWAVSFGMPSQHPDKWRSDVENARKLLPSGKVLVVSVVGTQDCAITEPVHSLEQLADDFALCARWAVDSGAHGVEANFSCPNVATADGQLYQQPAAAGFVAERIRSRIGDAPLVLKIGRVETVEQARSLLAAVSPFINGLAMTNSIAARVRTDNGTLLFDGQPRGICGSATLSASVAQTALFRQAMNDAGLQLDLIGVGGISNYEGVQSYLNAGATSVALATAAMVDPAVGTRIRHQLTSAR